MSSQEAKGSEYRDPFAEPVRGLEVKTAVARSERVRQQALAPSPLQPPPPAIESSMDCGDFARRFSCAPPVAKVSVPNAVFVGIYRSVVGWALSRTHLAFSTFAGMCDIAATGADYDDGVDGAPSGAGYQVAVGSKQTFTPALTPRTISRVDRVCPNRDSEQLGLASLLHARRPLGQRPPLWITCDRRQLRC